MACHCWRKFVLISWKNLRLRQRHWLLTSFEILMPILVALFLFWINSFGIISPKRTLEKIPEQIFPPFNETCLLQKLRRRQNHIIAYAPNTSETFQVIQHLSQCLNQEIVGDHCPYYQTVYNSSDADDDLEFKETFRDLDFQSFLYGRSLKTSDDYQRGIQFKAFQLETDIEHSLDKVLYLAAIIFEEGKVEKNGLIPYKIRMLNRFMGFADRDDNVLHLFSLNPLPGPSYNNTKLYRDSGFSGLQLCMDKSITKALLNKEFDRKILVQPFPFPEYEREKANKNGTVNADESGHFYKWVIPCLLILGFINVPPSIVSSVVAEKETGMREFLKMNGISGWMQWLGWTVNELVILSCTNAVIVLLLVMETSKEKKTLEGEVRDGKRLTITVKLTFPGIYSYSDPILLYVILQLFSIATIAFCFFLSSFFNKPTFGSLVATLVWPLTFYPIYCGVFKSYDSTTFEAKMLACIFPQMGLAFALRTVGIFERQGDGLKWSTVREPLNKLDPMCVAYLLLMFVMNTIVFMLLTVYLENVLPVSDYGIRRPFYYIFQLRTWLPNRLLPESKVKVGGDSENEGNSAFEAPPENGKVMIDIKHLQMHFGPKKQAVKDVTTKLYEGEIYALLGHNGAGKTTTISVISGLLEPTGGTAILNGFDIRRNLDGVRRSLGLCPQHNLYFKELSCFEHLVFFGYLKGMSFEESKETAENLLGRMRMAPKKNVVPPKLSGGMKRRLCLGVALIGNSKIVICDEPTSGMDPETRREIWDLLLELRKDRCILLTTHFMEEADVLGDRVGIMLEGKLICCGSPMFLKKHYQTGSTLNISLPREKRSNEEQILALIQHHVPQANKKKMIGTLASKAGSRSNQFVLTITLPTGTPTSKLIEMFSELDKDKSNLSIEAIGLSETTMDDVFLKAGASNKELEMMTEFTQETHNSAETQKEDEDLEGVKSESVVNIPETNTNGSKSEKILSAKPLTKPHSFRHQFSALMLKKFMYTRRKKGLVLNQILTLLITIVLAVIVSNSQVINQNRVVPLKISLESYASPISLYSIEDQSFSNLMKSTIGKSAKKGRSPMTHSLLKVSKSNRHHYKERYIIAEEETSTENGSVITAFFNSLPLHSSPLAINLASNAILKSLEPNKKYTIQLTNHPLSVYRADVIMGHRPGKYYRIKVPLIYLALFPVGLALYSAGYIILPIDEKVSQAKQIQLMTGLNPILYWNASFMWDYLGHLVLSALICGCIPLMEMFSVLGFRNGAFIAFLIMAVYGYGAIAFVYFFSLFCSSVAVGYNLVLQLCATVGLLLVVFAYLGERFLQPLFIHFRVEWVLDVFTICGRMLPGFGATIAWIRYADISFNNARCNLYTKDELDRVCKDKPDKKFDFLMECCDFCGKIIKDVSSVYTSYGFRCRDNPLPYVTREYEESERFFGEGFSGTVSGIGVELLYMFAFGLLYHILLIVYELGMIHKMLKKFGKNDHKSFNKVLEDEDVQEEINRVEKMYSSDLSNSIDSDALIVHGLCKKFGSFRAVTNLSFGVHFGECFGLLGVNGAGKTTSFKMLVSEESITMGSAKAFNLSLEKSPRAFVQNIGYCPQFDPIIEVLSGKEMLRLIGKLRGVQDVKGETDKWLLQMGLMESGNVACGKYSGGMKRRLSAAMAMIGNPPLIFLDEPTSGVDPVSRRLFWSVLSSVKASGQSIVLTSHSMDECEQLCDRMGIMVNGQFRCIGGPQHLKNKFAQGFNLKVKMRLGANTESKLRRSSAFMKNNQNSTIFMEDSDEEVAHDPDVLYFYHRCLELSSEIEQRFQPCELKDKNLSMMQYHLKNQNNPWDLLYRTMEDIEQNFKDIIEDYFISETTLEEVFISFARAQGVKKQSGKAEVKK